MIMNLRHIGGMILILIIIIFNLYHSKLYVDYNADDISSIEFMVYPQGGPHFIAEDRVLIQEFVNALNNANFSKTTERPDKSSDYYFYLKLNGKKSILIELDENVIFISPNRFAANLTDVCNILKQVCL